MGEKLDIEGIVEKVFDKDGRHSLKVDEFWVSFKEPQKCKEGDKVRVGGYKNDTGEKVFYNGTYCKVLEVSPPKSASTNQTYSRPPMNLEERESILRQVALKCANDLVKDTTNDTIDQINMAKSQVIPVAEVYFEWLKNKPKEETKE